MRAYCGFKVMVVGVVLLVQSASKGNLVNNPSMEEAFVEQVGLGEVAENWTGWRSGGEPVAEFYQPVPAYAHTGSKSQAIEWGGWAPWPFGPAGLYQQVTGLEAGKEYRLSVWLRFKYKGYFGAIAAEGINVDITCSVGADPNGGIDPNVVGSWGSFSHYTGTLNTHLYDTQWVNVDMSFSASGDTATVFMKAEGWGDAWGVDPYHPEETISYDFAAYYYIDDVVFELVRAGDFERDGDVEFFDFAVLANAWRSTPSQGNWNPDYDVSDPNDGVINELDLAVFVENWLYQ